MRKEPELSLTQLQTLWLNELGVGMLWGSPLKASSSSHPQSGVLVTEATTSDVTVVMPEVGVVAEEAEAIRGLVPTDVVVSGSAPEISLIKRSSPEGKTKSGRINKALQELHQELRQQSAPKVRQSLAIPVVQARTWEELEVEIKQQYLAWSWVQSEHEVLMGQLGKSPADLFIIEEMPGINDFLEGEEFAGDCGVLLAHILASIGLSKAQVAISSVLKFHAREAVSMSYALPYLQAQIQMLRPKCLLFLGARAAQSVLQQQHSMDSLRTQIWQYPLNDTESIPAVVSHHPSLLLINGALKAETWADLQKIAQVLKHKS